MPPIIDKSLAKGLRGWYAQRANERVDGYVDNFQQTGRDKPFLTWLKAGEALLYQTPRRPRPGLRRGHDIIYCDHSDTGKLFIVRDALDKRGELVEGRRGTLYLDISRHAVESLYQRLGTTDWRRCFGEIGPLGKWLMENAEIIANENEGLLLTTNGVFLVIRGESAKNDQLDGTHHWVATTWISDDRLEDHTSGKRRVAEAIREARSKGHIFTKA